MWIIIYKNAIKSSEKSHVDLKNHFFRDLAVRSSMFEYVSIFQYDQNSHFLNSQNLLGEN